MVGKFVADIIVEDTVILELKSVRQIIQAHEVQMVNYLVATEKACHENKLLRPRYAEIVPTCKLE